MSVRLSLDSLPRIADGEAQVDARGRSEPDTIVTHVGRPLRITFTRHDSWPCADRVVFPDFHVMADPPPRTDVVVELPPAEAGEYEFTCGMGILEGRLVVGRPSRGSGNQERSSP